MENTNNFIAQIQTPCNFEKCLTCCSTDCYTGQIAREHGKKSYDEFIAELKAAEKH